MILSSNPFRREHISVQHFTLDPVPRPTATDTGVVCVCLCLCFVFSSKSFGRLQDQGGEEVEGEAARKRMETLLTVRRLFCCTLAWRVLCLGRRETNEPTAVCNAEHGIVWFALLIKVFWLSYSVYGMHCAVWNCFQHIVSLDFPSD